MSFRGRVVFVAAFAVGTLAPTLVRAQQTRIPLVAPSTSFEDAIVQLALYYRQPIGLEVIDDVRPEPGTTRPLSLNLAAMAFDEAVTAVMERSSQPYSLRRVGSAVFIRPVGSESDPGSWLNRRPEAPGTRTIVGRREGQGSMTWFDPRMPPDLDGVTISEAWREVQRPGASSQPTRANLQQEGIRQRYPEVGWRVTTLPATTVWDTLAAVMTAHGQVAVWIVAHPGPRGVQGETTLDVVGLRGWFLTFPGLAPLELPQVFTVTNDDLRQLLNRRLLDRLPDALPPPQLPAPPAIRR